MTFKKEAVLTFIPVLLVITFLVHLIISNNIKIYGDEPEVAETAITILNSYKGIIRGNLSVLEPVSYLYGSIYTYLLAIVSFPFYIINNKLNIIVLNKENLYIFFRIINLCITLLTSFVLYKVLKTKLSKSESILFSLSFLLVPVVLTRSLFINQDILALFLYLVSILFFTKSINSKKIDKKYLLLYSLISGLTISAKITYSIPFIIGLIYIFNIKKDILIIMKMLIISILSFILSFPFSVINFSQYIERLLLLKELEGGISLDSHNLNPFFYLYKSFLFFLPITIFLLIRSKKELSLKVFKKPKIAFLLFQFLSLLLLFSFQIRKTDRWGLPIYMLFFLLLIFVNTHKKYFYISIINIFWLLILNTSVFSYYLNTDPRIELKKYITKNNSSKFIVLSEHGNNEGIQSLSNTEIYKHRIYEKKDDIFNYYPNIQNIERYDYLVISNGAIRDFNNIYNIKNINAIKDWKKFILNLESRKIKIIGAKEVEYEPQIGFTIYKLKNSSD